MRCPRTKDFIAIDPSRLKPGDPVVRRFTCIRDVHLDNEHQDPSGTKWLDR